MSLKQWRTNEAPFCLTFTFIPHFPPTEWHSACYWVRDKGGPIDWICQVMGSHWLPWIWRKQHQGTRYHCRVMAQSFSSVSILIYHIIYFAPPVYWVLKCTGGMMVEKKIITVPDFLESKSEEQTQKISNYLGV